MSLAVTGLVLFLGRGLSLTPVFPSGVAGTSVAWPCCSASAVCSGVVGRSA